MKDKKKRAGGGGSPPAGVYPTGNAPHDLGVVSFSELNQAGFPPFTNNQTMASVFVRDASLVTTGGNFGGPATITNAAGTQLGSPTNPEVVVADYVATVLQSVTPPTTQSNTGFSHLNSVQMEPGTIYVSTNNFADNVGMRFIWMGYNQYGSYRGINPNAAGTLTVITNTSSIPITPSMPHAVNVTGNPMQTPSVQVMFETSALSSQGEVMLEFKMTGQGKGQPVVSTATTNPIPGATFVGSCYMKIVFIA